MKVENWPEWLDDIPVQARCARCAGSGSTSINTPKGEASLRPLAVMAERESEDARRYAAAA